MNTDTPPKLVRRRDHKKSTILSGRTIGEARDHLETANERSLARKKDKRKKLIRIIVTSLCFIGLIAILVALFIDFINIGKGSLEPEPDSPVSTNTPNPTIPIQDEYSKDISSTISNRMKDYIGLIESDFRDLGYTVSKVIIPSTSIREVDVVLDGHPGFIKTIIDRDSAVSAEDADRMIRYLGSQGIEGYEYIDVRIEGKAYWR